MCVSKLRTIIHPYHRGCKVLFCTDGNGVIVYVVEKVFVTVANNGTIVAVTVASARGKLYVGNKTLLA